MIAHSIDCALQSGLFGRVIVSTDDDEIARIARAFGAEVPFRRPVELSDDYTGTTEVIAHSLDFLRIQGTDIAAACCIYATAPFIRQEDLKTGLSVLEAGDWDYVFSATNFGYPIWRSFQQRPDGGLVMFFPKDFDARSQDLPDTLHDAGQFYWGRPRAWLDRTPVFGTRSTVVVIPGWRVQDIDNEEDWIRAESMFA